MSGQPSVDGDVTPKAAPPPPPPPALLPLFMPPFLQDFSGYRQSTPPPTASPLPRTPKPRRFLNPPKTPLAKLHASFGGVEDPEGVDTSFLHAGMAITRPGSSCSTYSCSSDSSVDSNATYSTTGGSCTSIEDEDYPASDTPRGKIRRLPPSGQQGLDAPLGKGKEKQRSGRSRKKTQWTEEMDAHLWRTYALYQQDPKITPFFVLLGQVPPLGVCYKVARETKRSWREAKLRGDFTPVNNDAPKRTKPRAVQAVGEASNRGDSMRLSSPYTWHASESSTRRRLRELCRGNYGPSRNPYHHHQQQRRAKGSADMKSRPSVSPSPLKGSRTKMTNARDPFSTTRSMALSLTTSTASSMRPTGALASLTSGRDIHSSSNIVGRPDYPFGGIAERAGGAAGTKSKSDDAVLATGSLGLGLELAGVFGEKKVGGKREREETCAPTPKHHRQLSLDSSRTPTLLPALELGSSRSPYGTWPRRLKRPELQDGGGEPSTPPPPPRRRRGTLCDLFGGEMLGSQAGAAPATAPLKTRTRARGYTISAGTNPLGTRRRTRASAPLLTVTGPVSYEGELGSPIAKRDGRYEPEGGDFPRRLGSPFVERGRDE